MQALNKHSCSAPAPVAHRMRQCATRRRSCRDRALSVCAAQSSQAETTQHGRRALLFSGLFLASTVPALPSRAAYSSAPALCTQQSLEDSAVCRAADLQKDAGKKESYEEVASSRSFATTQGVPVAALDGEYAKATLGLASKIERYAALDVYDKSRIGFVKDLKTDSLTWVSKYARGGSVRSQSARKMYTAVDALLGHLSANGLAPYPASKYKKVQAALNETRQFLDQGR